MSIPYAKPKRLLDVLFSGVLLIIALLPCCIIALAVYADDPGPVLFRQYRIGRDEKPFLILKFRTMKTAAPAYMSADRMADRREYMTRVGRFLRRTSMDELPQLWNVLRGDMSLVGPRPMIKNQQDIHALRRNAGVYQLRPGITGLAQISGRERLSAEEKVQADARYLRELSFRLDVHILLRTLSAVVRDDMK